VSNPENFQIHFTLKINNENIKTNDFSQQLNKFFLFNFDQILMDLLYYLIIFKASMCYIK
jgi:hypothetical protein